MTYAYLTAPKYEETPDSVAKRHAEIDRILARTVPAAAHQHDQRAAMQVAALFGMEMGGDLA